MIDQQDDNVIFGVISFLLRAATVSSLSEPPSHTSGRADEFDDPDGDVDDVNDPDADVDVDDFGDVDVDEKAGDKRKEIKDKSLQTFPNLAAIFNELSSHSFMKVQHSLFQRTLILKLITTRSLAQSQYHESYTWAMKAVQLLVPNNPPKVEKYHQI